MIGRLVERGALTSGQERELRSLLAQSFEGVTPEGFRADLADKGWVLLLEEAGTLVGFSTLSVSETDFRGERLAVVFSGDTVVAPAHWGRPALSREWIGAVNRLRTLAPSRRWFWFLIVSGFRTYRFLPTFWDSFWPRHDAPTPDWEQGLLDHLAETRFSSAPRFGGASHEVVRLPRPQRLRAGLSEIPRERLRDPHVAFFAGANPGHVRGDELLCLTELAEQNLTRAGRRAWNAAERGMRKGRAS